MFEISVELDHASVQSVEWGEKCAQNCESWHHRGASRKR